MHEYDRNIKHRNIPNVSLVCHRSDVCRNAQSHNCQGNDWFLSSEVIDPYPGCKWKCPQHHSNQPALVLLERWEATCGKIKAISLDGAMSSKCRVWSKQLYLSACDKPWSVKAYWAPVETLFLESRQPPRLICVQFENFEEIIASILYAPIALMGWWFQKLVVWICKLLWQKTAVAYTPLIMPYNNVGRPSLSSYYLTRGGTRTRHTAGFYPSQWSTRFHAKKKQVEKNKTKENPTHSIFKEYRKLI